MALPQLIKSGVTTVTFPRERDILSEDLYEQNQSFIEMADGSQQAAEFASDTHIILAQWVGLPLATITAVRTFLSDPLVRYALYSFTWRDEDVTDWTVRWSGPSPFRAPPDRGNLYALTLRLRVE